MPVHGKRQGSPALSHGSDCPEGMAPPGPHPGAAGAMAAVTSRRGLRRLRTALWTLGGFARCGGREFRPVRGAGISRLARRDRGRCPLDPCNFFEKKLIKNFYSYAAAMA